ncbi:MAG: ABC transporter ATP-binding protein [Clostridiales bacterium]|nr:ABC transporter ATP-binding protein [Clostridiales bacterium]
MSDVLKVSTLSFSYGKKAVFEDISLALRAGEILCLMGPNGCGKTTLIDNIMAIHRPKAGGIRLMGQPLRGYKRHEIAQHIAYVPQIHNITFPYTVREVVLMGRTAYTGVFGEPKPEDEGIALEALEKIGIGRFAEKPYSQLSGGEVKLVLLARALCQKTAMIIMDEPTAHLDFKNELLFLETIVELCAKENMAVLMATHSPSHPFWFAAKGLNCRAAMMSQGKLIACGHPEDVVTERNIREVYGVKARITADRDDDGLEMKTVTLFSTI